MIIMKSTEVQNPRRNKCSVHVHVYVYMYIHVVHVVAEYRVPYRIRPRTIIMLIIIRMRTDN